MTIAAQLKQIEAAFEAWAAGNGGRTHIASDEYHAAFLLTKAPGATVAVILCHGEKKRGEFEESGFMDRTFWVVLSRGKGMKLEPGASLTEGVAGGKPMFDLVEEGRETIRRISFDEDTTEVTPNYLGWDPFPIEGYMTDAMRIEFSIGVQLPAANDSAEAIAPDKEVGN